LRYIQVLMVINAIVYASKYYSVIRGPMIAALPWIMQSWSTHQTISVQTEYPFLINKQKTNSMALSPRANYTDWATATCRRNLVPTLVDKGVSHGQHGGSPMAVNLSFLDRSRYFSFK
jgi:hypothetical protein